MNENVNIDEFNDTLNIKELNIVNNYESNKIGIINTSDKNNKSFIENNINNFSDIKSANEISKKKNKLQLFRILSSFVFVLAVASVAQTSFEIPVFTGLFSGIASAYRENYEYDFKSISSTYKSVSYVLNSSDEYSNVNSYLLLLNEGCDTDEYIASIPLGLKDSYKVLITSDTTSNIFYSSIDKTNIVPLISKTNYVIVVVRNEKIVRRQNITTSSKMYLSDVKVYFENEKINVTLKADASFTGFGTLLIQVKNLTNSTWGPENNGIDWTTGSEADLSTSKFNFSVAASGVDQYFEVKIYCITTDSEKISLSDTIIRGDLLNPEYYYLIYTYDKPLVLKGI